MRADLNLKVTQTFWETPKGIATVVLATAAIAGLLGYKLGQTTPSPPQVIVLQQPAPPSK